MGRGSGVETALQGLVSSPLFSLLSVLLLLGIALLSCAYYIGYGKEKRRKLPPGSMGLPLGIGENLQFVFCNSGPIGTPPPFLSSRLRKYGTVFKTHVLGFPTVISMDPDLHKVVFANEEKLVQVNFPTVLKRLVGPILTVHGERHLQFRELATSVLSPTVIQALHVIPLQEHTLSILRTWLKNPIVDAQHEFRKLIFTYMVRSFISLEPEDPTTKRLMKDYICIMNAYSSIPLNIPGTTYNNGLNARKRIMTIISNLVEARRKVIKREYTDISKPKDLVDLCFKEIGEGGKPFKDEDIVELIFALILGGYENTSVLLTNIVKFLSENVHVVDELRKEHTLIQKNKKENELLDWNDFKQMKFTQLVIKETLRVANVAHYVGREAIQDIVFKDMVIPKGWRIYLNFTMVHLNPLHYTDPLKFDPWRWEDTKNNNRDFFVPFSGGIRYCIGASLAKFESSLIIHYLVTRYKWVRIKDAGEQPDLTPMLGFPIMKKGLPIKVEPLQTNFY